MRRRPAASGPMPPTGTPRAAALRLLGRRDYTTAELTARLNARGFPAADVQLAIESLVREGLVDDARAARSHIRTARQVKGRGRLRIARELAVRGVPADVIDALLPSADQEDDREHLDRILERKRLPGRLTVAERQKLFRQLLRRGFPADLVSDALRRR